MTQRRKIMKTLSFISLLLITCTIVKVAVANIVICPRYCLCYFDTKTDIRSVSCVGRRLDNTDLSIPKRVQSLDLSNNSISIIEDGAFQNYGLVELVDLVIKHNLIQTIGLRSFAGLSHLKRLDLTDNRLYKLLPWTFHDNNNLKFISLSDNPLGHIPHSGPFLDIPSLETLLLSKCNFAHFPEEAFSALPNLKILNLSHNQLINFDVYTLQYLHNLEELDISSNPWQCNTDMENLKKFLESQSSKLTGHSCDLQSDIVMEKSKFEKIISVGIDYPEYDDLSGSNEIIEDISEQTEKQTNITCNCSKERKADHDQLILPPTLLSLISFQLGVCTTLFIGYFSQFCKTRKQIYQPLTVPTQTENESTAVIQAHEVTNGLAIQMVRETMLRPETPPPSYRDLFLTE